MSLLQIPYLNLPPSDDAIKRLSIILGEATRHRIAQVPWPDYPGTPEVSFAIAHDNDHIFLQFQVSEKNIAATKNVINDDVHEDSCVELFLSFDQGLTYYNLEFNCIGTCHGEYGPSRTERSPLDPSLIETIAYQTMISKSAAAKMIDWELTLAIPLAIFYKEKLADGLANKTCRLNLYKCGDGLPEPHYLAWSMIYAPAPDFHLPHFFGEAFFDAAVQNHNLSDLISQ